MRTFTKEKLNEILRKHSLWITGENGGEKADLSHSDLSGSNLSYSNLRGSNLRCSNLRGSNLRGSNLSYSDLSGSDLRGSNLSYSDLRGSNLSGSDLSYSDLSGSDLSGSNLRGSNLRCSNLRGSNLRGSNLNDEFNNILISYTTILPEGDIIGYKKCRDDIIVKLLIPAEAKRSNATGRKCRAEFAKVIEIYDNKNEAVSKYDENIIYRIGETIYPDKFDDNRWEECASGIHFFITKLEAEKYC